MARVLGVLVAAMLIASACAGGGGGGVDEGNVLVAGERRDSTAGGQDLRGLSADLNAFTLALYRGLEAPGDNGVVGPSSIAVALAMTLAGARGRTAEQIREAMRLTMPPDATHEAFNALEAALSSRGQGAAGKGGGPFRLVSANAVWLQEGFDVHTDYLEVLGTHYGAGVRLADFGSAPDEARQRINDWVADRTEETITELFAPGTIDTLTRLVLTNAVYFNAAWTSEFMPGRTQDHQFTTLSGKTTQVPMMQQLHRYAYAAGDGWQAVELAYDGGEVAMLAIVPDEGRFDDVEAALDVDSIAAELQPRSVALRIPKFSYSSSFDLPDALRRLGMVDAFSPVLADLSGMADADDLHIQAVVHQATVKVDEKGTEASAATGVVAGVTSAPLTEVELTIDRPFLFAIRDLPTGAVVFFGRVGDAAAP